MAPHLRIEVQEWGIAYDRGIGSRNFRGGLSVAFDGADAAGHRPLELKVDERNRGVHDAEDFQAEQHHGQG